MGLRIGPQALNLANCGLALLSRNPLRTALLPCAREARLGSRTVQACWNSCSSCGRDQLLACRPSPEASHAMLARFHDGVDFRVRDFECPRGVHNRRALLLEPLRQAAELIHQRSRTVLSASEPEWTTHPNRCLTAGPIPRQRAVYSLRWWTRRARWTLLALPDCVPSSRHASQAYRGSYRYALKPMFQAPVLAAQAMNPSAFVRSLRLTSKFCVRRARMVSRA